MRLKELAAARVRYGYRRLHILLRREGWPVNHKRDLPALPRRRAVDPAQGCPSASGPGATGRAGRRSVAPNEVWAMDFVSDQLFDGRPFRILTVVDCHTREALAIVPRASFRAFQVVEALDALAPDCGVGRRACGWTTGRSSPVGARPVGLPERGRDRLLPARQAHGQRVHRGVQQPPAGGVPERLVVLIHGRRQGPDRGLEVRLQWHEATFGARRLDAERLRPTNLSSPESCISCGPHTGKVQADHALTLTPDHLVGAGQGVLTAWISDR